MNSENRNTILLFVMVFAVAIIALIAVLAISWQIIGETVVNNVEKIGFITGRRNLDYRFEAPRPENEGDVYRIGNYQYRYTQDLAEDASLDFNFAKPVTKFSSDQFQIVDDILVDARKLGLGTDFGTNFSTSYSIEIPKIGLISDVYSGNGSDEVLKRGFWQTSQSNIDQEKVLLCYRKFLSPNDARSCWYLDTLSIGDSMYITKSDTSVEYVVVGIQTVDNTDSIYVPIDKDSVKLITTAPLDKLNRRLVVEAVRADSE